MINLIGGSGFIGTSIVKKLIKSDSDFKILDIKKPNHEEYFYHTDVCEISTLRKNIAEDSIIINLAAEHKDNITPTTRYYDVNVEGAKNICKIAEEKNVQTIIFTSSVAIYGFAKLDTDEQGEINPFNDYGKSKYEAELIYKKWQEKDPYNRTLTVIRPTVVFGERNRGNVYNLLKQVHSKRFLKIGLPYRILGGTKFYERAEIKDCVAYLRLIHQPKDDLAFGRIVNNPKRSIGESTIKLIHEFSKDNSVSLEIASKQIIEQNLIKPKTKIGLSSFLFLIDKWRNDINVKKINHVKLLQIVLDESGYSAMLKNKKDLENENRLENIKELLSAMKDFDGLEAFLEHVALATSIDQDWDGEKVNMMTMHGSKGLEFDVVFLPGWEEGLFPHQKSIEEKGQNGLEEERRLAYVGITRAKNKALISFAMNRFYQGNWIDSMASRFIDELPEKYLEKNSFFDESKDNDNDFEFNQDFEVDEGKRSPGWARYQKRIK